MALMIYSYFADMYENGDLLEQILVGMMLACFTTNLTTKKFE
jgi:hypothetical protein